MLPQEVRIVYSIPKLCMAMSMYAIEVCAVSGCDGGMSHNGPKTNVLYILGGLQNLDDNLLHQRKFHDIFILQSQY